MILTVKSVVDIRITTNNYSSFKIGEVHNLSVKAKQKACVLLVNSAVIQ